MFEARVKRDFTFEKFKGHGTFKKGETISDLTGEDVAYLTGANPKHVSVIEDVKEIVEEAVEVKNVEKAVKATKKKNATKK